MAYTEEQVKHTSKLIVSALYKEITIEEAKSKMLPELISTDIYENFVNNVTRTKARLNGETPHFRVPLKWAKPIYENLKDEHKLPYLKAIMREIEVGKTHNVPSIRLSEWVKQNEQ
jgi:hypothetical protein